jgi:hypothetical protein
MPCSVKREGGLPGDPCLPLLRAQGCVRGDWGKPADRRRVGADHGLRVCSCLGREGGNGMNGV